jgi:hypothetical protein
LNSTWSEVTPPARANVLLKAMLLSPVTLITT